MLLDLCHHHMINQALREWAAGQHPPAVERALLPRFHPWGESGPHNDLCAGLKVVWVAVT
eukprot:32260-Eustigmatos_ZCMA.PRE.1